MQATTLGPTLIVTLALTLGGEQPSTLTLDRSTSDAGGIMRSGDAATELSGTIGQPDAGILTGGNLELRAGFWFGLGSTDCNEDGRVGLPELASYAACLQGPGSGPPPAPCRCFDTDGSGFIDLLDFAAFQRAYFTP